MKHREKLELVRDNTLWRLKVEMLESTRWGTWDTKIDTPIGFIMLREEDYDEDGNILAYTWCINEYDNSPENLKRILNEIYNFEREEEGEALFYYYNSWNDEWIELGSINEVKKLVVIASDEDFEYMAKDIERTYEDIMEYCREQEEEWWG